MTQRNANTRRPAKLAAFLSALALVCLAATSAWGWQSPAELQGHAPHMALGLQRAEQEYTAEEDQKAIEAARDALASQANFPFYDESKDAIRKINIPPQELPQKSKTTTGGSNSAKARPTTTRAGTTTGSGLSGFSSVLQVLGLIVLIAALVAIAVLIARTFLRGEVAEQNSAELELGPSRDVDRVEQLPFQLKRPSGDFLTEARLAYEQGDFARAIIYFYSHQLVQLDRHQWIRLSKGKTNRQYLRELRSKPELRDLLDETILLFESAFFGHHDITRSQFEAVWRRAGEFQQLVLQQEALTA